MLTSHFTPLKQERRQRMVTIKSKKEIELMKDVCRIVATFYKELEKKVKPGISTFEFLIV